MTQPTQPTPPQRPMGPPQPQQQFHGQPPQQQFTQPPPPHYAGDPARPPVPPQLADPPVKKSGWYKSKVAIGIGALLLGLILGSASAGGSKTGTAAAASTVTITGAPGGTITQQVTTTATVATTVTAQPAPPAGTFKDGMYLVNKDIKPGQYRAANESGRCYWARLKDTEGGLNSILANGNPDGVALVTIKATDVAFESSGCGSWQPV